MNIRLLCEAFSRKELLEYCRQVIEYPKTRSDLVERDLPYDVPFLLELVKRIPETLLFDEIQLGFTDIVFHREILNNNCGRVAFFDLERFSKILLTEKLNRR